jgi:hypothetical protein
MLLWNVGRICHHQECASCHQPLTRDHAIDCAGIRQQLERDFPETATDVLQHHNILCSAIHKTSFGRFSREQRKRKLRKCLEAISTIINHCLNHRETDSDNEIMDTETFEVISNRAREISQILKENMDPGSTIGRTSTSV